MKYDSAKALILGAGVSGEAAAELIRSRNGTVTLLDRQIVPELRSRLEAKNIACFETDTTVPDDDFTVCIASPSISPRHPWLQACGQRGIPVVSEIELAAAYWQGKTIAVTGSKGKSSLVKFCAETLSLAGIPARACGNYGFPFARVVLERTDQVAVVEISSFQMEHTSSFAPDCAILLNIQNEHLDRHETFENYRRLKLKLFAAMKPGGLALIPFDFDAPVQVPQGVQLRRFDLPDERIESANSYFGNPVLLRSLAAGTAALDRLGLAIPQINAGLRAFTPLPHRFQTVTEKDGVLYIDDSKATNLSALIAGLEMAGRPVRLIAGGLLKEKDLTFVKEKLSKHAKKVYLIGTCAQQMKAAWEDSVPCELCTELDAAVEAAVREARSGEAVLLSPGTASFDQFRSYGERGDTFAKKVRELTANDRKA